MIEEPTIGAMMKSTYRNAGRRFYPQVVFEQIIERVEQTGLSVEKLCEDRSLPSAVTVYAALLDDPELGQRYALAMQSRRAAQPVGAV
jgi:hypothetical protein